MKKRLLEILDVIIQSKQDSFFEKDFTDINLPFVDSEFFDTQLNSRFDNTETDIIKAIVSYILIKDTNLHPTKVYDLVFKQGKKILWN